MPGADELPLDAVVSCHRPPPLRLARGYTADRRCDRPPALSATDSPVTPCPPPARTLVRDGRELPLIPRCFDLLVLLIERRNEAVSRHEILDAVWSDVVVTDGALSQAVRTLRRTLGDDPRAPTFIRTLPRHGYRFVCDDVVEEPDEGPAEPARAAAAEPVRVPTEPDANASFDQALATLLDDDSDDAEGADIRRRQAAETLHHLGTAKALDRLSRGKRHAVARAYLRETRWDVPGAGPVPLFGHPGWLAAARILFLLRIRRVARLARRRWMAAAAGGAAAGAIAGFLGGLVLRFGPASTAGNGVLTMLPLLGNGDRRCRGGGESGPVWPPRKPPFARGGGWPSPRPGRRAVWPSARSPTSWDASCSRVSSVAISRR